MNNQQKPRSIHDFPLDEQIKLLTQIRDLLIDALADNVLQGVDIPQLAPQTPVVEDFTAEALQEVEAILL